MQLTSAIDLFAILKSLNLDYQVEEATAVVRNFRITMAHFNGHPNKFYDQSSRSSVLQLYEVSNNDNVELIKQFIAKSLDTNVISNGNKTTVIKIIVYHQ